MEKLKIEQNPTRRTFRRCKTCGVEWPTSSEYCMHCSVWLGSSVNTEDIRWFVLPIDFRATIKRALNDGVYEASVLTIAACHSIYSGLQEGVKFFQSVATQIVHFGGLILRGPGGHLVGCFIGKNIADGAIRSVDCACAIRTEAQKRHTMRTFLGVNTGPVLLKIVPKTKPSERQVEVSSQVLARSAALAFSLLPGMIVLSPATFHLVGSVFDCYGTGTIGLWGENPAALGSVVYVVIGPKKAESWKHCLDDDAVPLFGREKELSLLRWRWERTVSGTNSGAPFVLHLVGEPGSGKSKLLQAFLTKITNDDRRVTVLKVAGSHYGGRPGSLLRELANECSREERVTREVGVESFSAWSLTSREIQSSQPGRIIRHLQRIIQALVDPGPLIMVIDDLHWADNESVRMIGRMLRFLSGGIMVIVSYRRSGSKKAKPLQGSNTARIVLKALEESTGKKISTFHSGKARFAESLWQEIWLKSKGNPLYIEEATRLLYARKSDEAGAVAHPTGASLPDTMAGLVIVRIKEWADRELNGLRKDLQCRLGQPSLHLRLSGIEKQINDWLDRLETRDYIERSQMAESLEVLERFQNDVVMICIVNGLNRPLTTRLGEAVSRLYDGCYKDHYMYLQRCAVTSENLSSLGLHSLRVARRALEHGWPREAVAFFEIADEALLIGHPLRKTMLVDAGNANLMLGCLPEAIRFYERSLKEEYPSQTEDVAIRFRLAAARILNGEETDLLNSEQHGDSPWDLVIKSLAAVLSGNMETATNYAAKAEGDASNWVSGSYLLLLGALARLAVGDPDGAVACCMLTAEMVPTGGTSLTSFGLHWVLSQATQGHSRQRHMRTWRDVARRLGIISGLSFYQSRLVSLESQTIRKSTTKDLRK